MPLDFERRLRNAVLSRQMTIGDRILERITSSSLFRIERAGESHIIVWSSGAAEQLEAIAVEAIKEHEAKRDK